MEANELIVSNSSPLIHLAKVGQLGLLEKLYGRVLISPAVFVEITEPGKPGVADLQNLIATEVLQIEPVQNQDLVTLLAKDLDRGESEAIALAIERKADLILLDETDARQVAELYGLKKTGFLGILLRAHQRGWLPEVKAILDEAIQKGFHIYPKLYAQLMTAP